jgi:hypothetical protein
MLSGDFAGLQAPKFECLSFDPFSPLSDFAYPAEVGVGQRVVVEAIVMIVMSTKAFGVQDRSSRMRFLSV